MKYLIIILVSVFVLSFGTNAFAYRGMGCDSYRPQTDQNGGASNWHRPTDHSGGHPFTPPDSASDDSQNQDGASQDQNNAAGADHPRQHPRRDDHRPHGICPHDGSSDDSVNPWTPPDDSDNVRPTPWNPSDDSADDSDNVRPTPWNPSDDSADDDSNPYTPPDDSTDDNPASDDPADVTPAFASGTLTVSGSGFGASAGSLMGILCLPADTVIDASIVSQLAERVEGVMAGMLQADGSIANILSPSQPITLANRSLNGVATLSGGEHLVVILIDNAPSITDFIGFSDISDNDMVAITTVTIDGDTSINLDYNTLSWTAFGDF